jgi:hypothetical protein
MSLTIATPSIPDFFEGVPIPPLQFVASGTISGATYQWSADLRNEQGVLIPLPDGLSLSSGGLLTGTPLDISDDGPGLASGVNAAFALSINSPSDVPPIFGGNQIVVAGVRYPVSRFIPGVGGLYTVELTVPLTGTFSNQTYKIIPIGGAKASPVIIRINQVVGPDIVATASKEFRMIVLKLNNVETLYKYLNQATDADGRLLDSTYKTIIGTLSPGEQQAFTSLVAGGQAIVNQQTGQLEKFLVLPAFAIEV